VAAVRERRLLDARLHQAVARAPAGPFGLSGATHCFGTHHTPRKPRKTAAPELVELYKERMKQRNLNVLAIAALRQLQRDRAKENGGTAPRLHVGVDGS